LVNVFIRAGFEKERETGSHIVFTKPGVLRPVIIPKYNDVGVEIIQRNLRTANMSREEYFKLLESH
jgi:predicted RNA binding protein YcfA (HicA-like mRNA interferase family)